MQCAGKLCCVWQGGVQGCGVGCPSQGHSLSLLLQAGRQSEASDLEARLHDAVERYERSGGTEIMQFEE